MIEAMIMSIENGSNTAIVIAFAVVVIMSMAPFIPLPIVYGTIGYSFTGWLALSINLAGSLLGTLLFFSCIRYLFHRKAAAFVIRHHRAQRLFALIERNGFQVVLIARIIPVVPSILVNSVSALSNLSVQTFLLATAIGKLPLIAIYTIAGNQVDIYTWQSLLFVLIYTVALLIVAKYIQNKWNLAHAK
ncbi:VTT domain-containing protein [Chryseomicrobium sp. FSL W7-1435]|uniref:TVP38/TMEM64 family protein n=1 Tax=Chryseomicrobium sp. FSL W7-1435 TaxID=2921704 RepID=UPI00315AD0F4